MATAVPSANDERLPWLEPYVDPIVAKAPSWLITKKSGAAIAFGAVVCVAIALLAGYFLGLRNQPEAPASLDQAAETMPTVKRVDQAPSAEAAIPLPTIVPVQVAPKPKSADQLARNLPAHMVQLGAFRTRKRALFAYRMQLVQRPRLASMRHIVVPVTSKPGGRVLYALRLGTSSRQQSRDICRNIRASGNDCLVIG